MGIKDEQSFSGMDSLAVVGGEHGVMGRAFAYTVRSFKGTAVNYFKIFSFTISMRVSLTLMMSNS